MQAELEATEGSQNLLDWMITLFNISVSIGGKGLSKQETTSEQRSNQGDPERLFVNTFEIF